MGKPIDRSMNEELEIPDAAVDEGEELYRVGSAIEELNIRVGDLLVVHPRPKGNATSGELVLCRFRHEAYLGRWWRKHGRRALLGEEAESLAEGPELRVLGVVTVVIRMRGR